MTEKKILSADEMLALVIEGIARNMQISLEEATKWYLEKRATNTADLAIGAKDPRRVIEKRTRAIKEEAERIPALLEKDEE